MAITKVGQKFQVTIPHDVRKQADIEIGDLIDVKLSREGIVLRPKITVDKHPLIEKELQRGLEDIKKGRMYGPFYSAKEFKESLESNIKSRKKSK
jgi:AbrB family looped-hinge helix DNA binding protein